MSWFTEFVSKTKTQWQSQNRGLGSLEGGFESTEVGRKGEKVVQRILEHKEYTACLSPQSQTPADVWGMKKYRPFTHIALIQVKATKADTPYELTPAERSVLENFCRFVKDEWNTSFIIPDQEKKRPLIFSVGYAGIIFTGKGYTTYQLYQCEQICTRTKGIPADIKEDAEDKVRILHLLRTRSV